VASGLGEGFCGNTVSGQQLGLPRSLTNPGTSQESVGHERVTSSSPKDTFHVETYLPVSDCFSAKLRRRFSAEATAYNISAEDLFHKIFQARQLLHSQRKASVCHHCSNWQSLWSCIKMHFMLYSN